MESPYYVVGGYVARVERWGEFEKAWKQTLAADPAISYLHMWEARARKRQFEGWSYEATEEKVAALAAIIKDFEGYELSVTLTRATFDEVVAKRLLKDKTKNPYYLCYLFVMVTLLGTGKDLLGMRDEKLDLIFDQQPRSMDVVTQVHNRFTSSADWHWLGGLTFQDDKRAVPLQAADLLAWTLRRNADKKRLPASVEPVLSLPAMRLKLTAEQIERYGPR